MASKMLSPMLTRDFIIKAVENGLTPEDVIRELGDPSITTVTKLNAAIRRLYDKQGYANKRVKGLAANRRKPVLAAPREENATADADAKVISNLDPTEAKVENASDEDAKAPVAESPAAGTVKPANQVPENPASVQNYMTKDTQMYLELAQKFGCILSSEYIVNYYDEVTKLPMDKVYVPQCVLNTVRSLVKFGRVGAEMLERIEFLEKNAHIMQKAPSDIAIVDASVPQKCVLLAKHVVNVRRICLEEHLKNGGKRSDFKPPVVLTKSREVRNLVEDYEKKNN